MPRRNRIFIEGLSAHIIVRGHNRAAIFEEEGDYVVWLSMLRLASTREGVDVHAFTLMTTHVHLLATPRHADALPRAMKDVNGAYVRYYNHRRDRIGTLWNGRYRAILIDTERYWLTCLRYIEQNPVRAGMVKRPEEYRWSSYRAHALGEQIGGLAPHAVYTALGNTPGERQSAYKAICDVPVTRSELTLQRQPIRLRGAGGRVLEPASATVA